MGSDQMQIMVTLAASTQAFAGFEAATYSGFARFQSQRQVVKASELAYSLAFVMWITLLIFNSSFFARYISSTTFMGIRVLCLLLLIFSELAKPRHSIRAIRGLGIAALMGVAVMTAHESILIDNIAFIYCSREKNLRRVVRMSLHLTATLVCLIIACSLAGIIQNYSGWSGGRMRSYLGFRYALFPSQYLYLISCLSVYLLGRKTSLRHVVILFAANYVIHRYTSSRLSFASSSIIVLLAWLVAKRQRVHGNAGERDLPAFVRTMAPLSFVLSAACSILLTLSYNPSKRWMAALNGVQLLGGRLSIGQQALRSYPLRLFGRELHFVGAALDASGAAGPIEAYNTIDCLYVRMLVNYGAVFFILFIALFTAVTVRALREKNAYLVIILVSIALLGTIDNLSLHLQYDTFLLLIGTLMNKPAQSHREVPHG